MIYRDSPSQQHATRLPGSFASMCNKLPVSLRLTGLLAGRRLSLCMYLPSRLAGATPSLASMRAYLKAEVPSHGLCWPPGDLMMTRRRLRRFGLTIKNRDGGKARIRQGSQTTHYPSKLASPEDSWRW